MHCGAEVTESSTNKQHHLSRGTPTVLNFGGYEQFHNFLNIRFFAPRNIVRRAGFRRDRRRANLQRRPLGSAAIVGMYEALTYTFV
jgi:hypothetical protein